MAQILRFLILFLLLISNSYADNWYGWHRCGFNSDWWCYTPPACIDQTEVRSLSCPVHQSGAINQTRFYVCSTESWSSWTTTSNNCTQDPPTCTTTTELRSTSCVSGYEGLITESRSSICLDPYGTPTWTTWSQISNTCKMSMTNQANVSSPVSIASPMSVLTTSVSPTVIEPVIAPLASVQTLTLTPEIKTETKQETKSEEPKSKEIVPGLGMVLSIGMLTKSGLEITQPSMVDSYNLEQEDEYGVQQGIFMGFIIETDIYDRFNTYSSRGNTNLLRNYNFQQNAFSR